MPILVGQLNAGVNGLDNILNVLFDGEWHRVDALSERLELPEDRLKTMLEFLSEHGFVQYRTSDGSVRIDAGLKALMES